MRFARPPTPSLGPGSDALLCGMIHQRLVRPGALVAPLWVTIKCVHVDVHDYPVAQSGKVKVAVDSRLTHPLILGIDWAGFQKLAGQCSRPRRVNNGCTS